MSDGRGTADVAVGSASGAAAAPTTASLVVGGGGPHPPLPPPTHPPRSFFKSGMESHGISINYEADDLANIHGPICRMEGMHCRGEDWPFPTQGE